MDRRADKYLKWLLITNVLILSVTAIMLSQIIARRNHLTTVAVPKYYPAECGRFIKSWEGYSATAYMCPGNVWTIGWGTTIYPNGSRVRPGDVCTIAEAEIYFSYDLDRVQRRVQALTGSVNLSMNQLNALVSFEYNTGRLENSILLDKLKDDCDDRTIYSYDPCDPLNSCEFLKYIWSKGRIVQGLINRRIAESDMYKR